MTTYSNVKTCMASLKSVQEGLSKLALTTKDSEVSRLFHECMMETDEIVKDLQQRIALLEREEPQYGGN